MRIINQKKPHRYFATFLDANYLPKAIITYRSLCQYHTNFSLYAFCFDNLSYDILKKLNYRGFIPVHTSDFELNELLATKNQKEKYYEYYWSYKPYLIMRIMKKTGAEIVTYIDCDFLFFDTPEYIFKEMGNADVLLQPNNFSAEEVEQFIPVGYYCSCYESFRNNANGRKALKWWHKQCVKWCLAKFEKGRFADQKYLDDWRTRFEKVKEITHIGANVAPWNIQKYDISVKKTKIFINNMPLIYYHYHSFKMNLNDYSYIITGDRENFYRIPQSVQRYIYRPYIDLMKKIIIDLKNIPSYTQYAKTNPESKIKFIDPKRKASFNSYKRSVND